MASIETGMTKRDSHHRSLQKLYATARCSSIEISILKSPPIQRDDARPFNGAFVIGGGLGSRCYSRAMSRFGRFMIVLGSLVFAAAATTVVWRVELWVLRSLYQFGEWVGITARPPAPGASLGGQVLGFNFARPPHWWGFAVFVVAVAAPLILVFVLMLLGASRQWAKHRRASVASVVVAAAVGGMVAGLLERFFGVWLMMSFVDVFEFVGGTVTRLSGVVGFGSSGPFHGGTWTDAMGNWFVRWAPSMVPALVGACVAHFVYRTRLRSPSEFQCLGCGYDRQGIGIDAPCPECGKANRKIAASAL